MHLLLGPRHPPTLQHASNYTLLVLVSGYASMLDVPSSCMGVDFGLALELWTSILIGKLRDDVLGCEVCTDELLIGGVQLLGKTTSEQ